VNTGAFTPNPLPFVGFQRAGFRFGGTGKTIVALHRGVHLARENPQARVLLTTFSKRSRTHSASIKIVRVGAAIGPTKSREHLSERDAKVFPVGVFIEQHERVTLVGRLDISGAAKIEARLREIAGSDTNIVIDMEGVDFLALNSVWEFVIAAKTICRRARAKPAAKAAIRGYYAPLPI
jgi:hypothetical protein